MKKDNKPNKPRRPAPTKADGPGEPETYPAPPPPSKGRVVGLDCHPDTFTSAVFRATTPHDAVREGGSTDMSLAQLLEWAGGELTGEDLVLMEAGSNSFELAGRLRAMGLRVAVLESRHVGKRARDYADNDRIAAERIAMVYLEGRAPCVWIPDAGTIRHRHLLHAYRSAVKAHTAARNAFRAFLNTWLLRLGKRNAETDKSFEWILRQRNREGMERKILGELRAEMIHQSTRRKRLTQTICREVCTEPLMLRVMKILGIGPINAFALLAVVGDVSRFEAPAKLVAYIGLNPGQRISGRGKHVKLGVGGRGRRDMRCLVVQAAQAVFNRGAATKMGAWALKLFFRKGQRNIAVVALARKLLVQVWHVLSGNPPTALEAEKSYELKLRKLLALLGRELRAELGLPAAIPRCVEALRIKTLAPCGT